MKAAPKVNTEGLYLEDTIVDDAFVGVVPFYADLPGKEPVLAPDTDPEESEEEAEPEIAGYIVGIPVTQGLYRPRFDLAAWKAHQDNQDSSELPELWVESLTKDEIEALHPPQPLTSEDVLAAQLVQRELDVLELKKQNAALGAQVVEQDLTTRNLKAQYEALGTSLVALELKLLNITTNKGGGDE